MHRSLDGSQPRNGAPPQVAFAMALHDRLGAGSSAAILQSQELADIICRKAKKP